ncbi:MAG: hypothetical protein IT374_12305 [Polyangiaceae bacterium]|nr:hypothetical protein [Polyangiaceae bacterium]
MSPCPSCRADELTPLRRGGYFCEGCGRRFDAELAPFVAPRAVAREAWDDPSLPFTIAHPLSAARDASAPLSRRFDAAATAAYEIVRGVGLLLLSDYLASTARSRRVAVALRALRAPDWWAWTVLNNQLCRFWSGELDAPPDRETAFPRVAAGWRSVNRQRAAKRESRWGTLLEGLPGRRATAAESANDALWRAREDVERARDGDGEVRGEEELERLLAVIDASTSRLFPRGSVELVRRVAGPLDEAHLVRLHGAHADLRFPVEVKEREWAAPFGVSPIIAVTRDATVPLHPVFLRFDGATRRAKLPTAGLLEPLVRDGAGARLVPWAASTEAVSSGTFAALRRRGADVLAGSLELVPASLSQIAAGMLEAAAAEPSLRGRGAVHVARAGVDDVAEEALRTAGRALMIVGARGVGKTTLAARLALSLAGLPASSGSPPDATPRPDSTGALVVFLSGRNAYAGPDGEPVARSLKRTVLARLGVRDDAFPSLHHFFAAMDEPAAAEGRRVVLVLDAIDEADDVDGLVAALDDLLPALSRHRSLRLCVTMRTSSFRALGRGRGPRALEHVGQLLSFPSGRGDGLVPHLEVRAFSPDELARAYAARRAGQPALPALAELPEETRRLLALPLHLELWTAGFPATGAATDAARLFDAFFEEKRARLPELGPALAEVGQALVRRRTYDLLGVTRAPSKRKGTLAPRVPSGVEPSALVELGVWRRPEDDGRDGPLPYAFAHPALGDQIVLEALGLARGVPSGEALLKAAELAATTPTDAFPAVLSALSVLVERLARAGEGEPLAWLLGAEDTAASEHLLTAALTSLGPLLRDGGGPGSLAHKTLEELVIAAQSDPRFGERLTEPLRAARAGLLASGHVAAAIAVERAALRALRARIAEAPDDVELQLRLGASMTELLRLAILGGDWPLARKLAHDTQRLGDAAIAAQPDDPSLAGAVAEGSLLAATVLSHDARLDDARRVLEAAKARAATARDPRLSARADAALAELAVRRGDLTEARARLLAALDEARVAATSNGAGDADLRAIAGTLRRLGDVEHAAGRGKEARRRWEDATSTLRSIVAREPYFFGAAADLSATLRRLGNQSRVDGRREDARRALDEAIEGATFLAAQPGAATAVEVELALALHDAGVLAFLEGKRSRATKLLTRVIDVASRLAGQAAGDELAHARASAVAHLGHVARAEGKRGLARARFDEALAEAPLPGQREDRAVDLANVHLAAAEVAESATMKNAHLMDAKGLLAPYRDRPGAARLLELVRRAERS